MDTVSAIVRHSLSYKIAILPLYGGNGSYIWTKVSITFLRALRKKIILIVHGGSIPDKMKVQKEKYLPVFESVDKIICPSPFLQEALKQYNIETTLIENVVNLQSYNFTNKNFFRPRIFWMRTLEDIYNPEMAIRVAAILAAKYPDFKMVMAGHDKGALSMTRDLARKLNIADKVSFPGYISHITKNKLAADYDIYICTNRIDNAPVTFVEMMAMGLPIVSVNIGGIPYLITDNENGLLVNLDDDENMAAKVISLIEEPLLGKRLAANALVSSKKYDEAPVLNKWNSAFEELKNEPTVLMQ